MAENARESSRFQSDPFSRMDLRSVVHGSVGLGFDEPLHVEIMLLHEKMLWQTGADGSKDADGSDDADNADDAEGSDDTDNAE
eukprot:scaffold16181_cov47-Cyclotella_meneghiniana.AAC.3